MGTAFFEGYEYKNHVLTAEGVSFDEIAEKVGTPCYVYVSSHITQAYQELEDSLKEIPHLICFSVKANSNIAILKILSQLGAGVDIVSQGELKRALCVDIPPNKIVFSGVGKTREEIDHALQKKILCFNVESEQELLNIDMVAKNHKKVASVMIRINPDVDAKTHPAIATGLRHSKFGIPYRKTFDLVRSTQRLKNIHLLGFSCHIGSQIVQTAPFVEATKRMLRLYEQVESKLKLKLTHIDMGGGLGITYQNENPPKMSHWAQSLIREIKDRQLILILEPGRSIVGNAGVLLTKVIYVKRNESENFIVVDAGMNDLIRPALYGSWHTILPTQYRRYKKIKASVVGPCCESGDIITKSRRIQNFQQSDLLAIMSCGAYAASMGNNYNSRLKAPEVLLKDGKYYVIRERETFQDLIQKEKIPAFLQVNAPSTARLGVATVNAAAG